MNKSIFKPLEKVADINIKSDFFTDALEGRVIDECFKTIPVLKDENYKLIFNNKDDEAGHAIGYVDIALPQKKNPGGKLKLKIPIIIHNFKLKPIDTFVLNNVAYPANDLTIKELMMEPDNFRTLTQKEIRESRILSKVADECGDQLLTDLKKMAEESSDENEKYFSIIHLKGAEHYLDLKKKFEKTAENYSEPINDYIVSRRKDFNFNLFYIKKDKDNNLKFASEVHSPESIRLLLEATGYDSVKMADELNSGNELMLDAPIVGQEEYRSMAFDPKEFFEKSASGFSDVNKGSVEVLDGAGNLKKGFVFDLFGFSSMANNFPSSKIFVDLEKNYTQEANFDGRPAEGEFLLKEDDFEPGDKGIFIDNNTDNAYGIIKILNHSSIPKEGDILTVNINNKKYKIKQVDLLKNYVINDDEILIPKSYQWVSLNKKINVFPGKVEDKINQKIAESSYVITNKNNNIRLTSLTKKADVPLEIPTIQHLKLLVKKLNFLTTDLAGLIQNVERGQSLTFSTSFPLNTIGGLARATDLTNMVSEKNSGIGVEVVKIIKSASKPITNLFPKLFNLRKEARYEELLKEAGSEDTLDTIFSLNIVNDINSSIFLQNIEKLKFTMSYLSALRLYIRYGWINSINEGDITAAIDSLSNIIQGLQTVKTQKLLNKQLMMQN